MTAKLRLREALWFGRRVRTRFPFRFGKSSMTEMPVIHLRAAFETPGGAEALGVSASGIPPLWFDKRPGKTPEDNERDLLLSCAEAANAYAAAGFGSPWDLHVAITAPVRGRLVSRGIAPLAAGFGPALLEAAAVDAACRLASQTFATALRNGGLGLPPGEAARLPETPLDFVRLRHTVGLADALDESDLANPLRDGLPETLAEVVRAYRPAYFKVKISGDPGESSARLRRIAEILDREAGDYAVTLDGNEQFPDMESFEGLLENLRGQAALQPFLRRILWIEQPVARDAALRPDIAPALERVGAYKPVIIDESDGEEDALERALALGYAGVSSKTCKGLFRSVSHYLRLPPGGILSSEDLTTVPVLPLQQDLCLAAALGLRHSERNGHHYIRGFDFLSPGEREQALAEAPSLYVPDGRGGAAVRIEGGGFRLSEVNAALGFGSSCLPDWKALEPISLPS